MFYFTNTYGAIIIVFYTLQLANDNLPDSTLCYFNRGGVFQYSSQPNNIWDSELEEARRSQPCNISCTANKNSCESPMLSQVPEDINDNLESSTTDNTVNVNSRLNVVSSSIYTAVTAIVLQKCRTTIGRRIPYTYNGERISLHYYFWKPETPTNPDIRHSKEHRTMILQKLIKIRGNCIFLYDTHCWYITDQHCVCNIISHIR